MSTLEAFDEQIKQLLREKTALLNASPAQINHMMDGLQAKQTRFENAAEQLVTTIISPRLKTLVAHFRNADMDPTCQRDRCVAWFGFCDRFPASCKIELLLDHDDALEHAILRCEVRITPVFFKYEPHDKLSLPLDNLDAELAASWVERQLLAFLNDYLRLDRGDESRDDEIVTDPVCGMRISRGLAAAQGDYRGHPYFFCTLECQRQFLQEPSRFVWFRT